MNINSINTTGSNTPISNNENKEARVKIRNENNELSHAIKIDLIEDIMKIF